MLAIEKIKSGDKVISTDPETMETSPKTVLETYIREVTTLVHLTVNGEEIVTTVDHPFYVKNQGFIKAGELIVGDELLDSNCNVLLVENHSVELTDEPVTVYNFQVEDFHTYHVGKCRLLVHNANCNQEKPVLPKYDGKTTEGVMVTPDGKQISFKSGNSSTPSYPQYKAQSASHVEGKAALYMRENGINEATVFHNNPNGTCGFCDRQVPALLPKGAKLTVVPPSNSVANNVRAIPVPKTYIGNKSEFDTSKISFPRPYKKLVKSINDEDRDAFLKYLRGWYKGSVDSAWYGTHELVNKYQYYGYWCFEAGAIAKRLGFVDDDLKNEQYYPYDMVHFN